MIPYDDLVVALQNWRARQGLPVATISAPAPAVAAPPPAPSAPARPPTPPPGPRTAPPGPPPLAQPETDTHEDSMEVDPALVEDHYDNEGNDFAMAFNNAFNQNAEHDGESTAIGVAPPGSRDSFSGGGTVPDPRKRNDW
jgi:hypothetical protein